MSLLYPWWAALPHTQKRQWQALALCAALFLFHYTWYSAWYIEDAAISFSYSRHLASGEGLVPYPGGERVEGFSNPTWTLLLASFDLQGLTGWDWATLNPWITAKVFGAVFGLICLPLAMVWTRRLVGDAESLGPVLAPFLLALSPTFVCWCAAGLENPLLFALMMVGSVLVLREAEARRFPWSALAWSFLAFTRPEAPLYAAVGLGLGALLVLQRQGWRTWLWWVARASALFLVPFLVWHVWRYLYFAWEFPNTYYAKLGERQKFLPFAWNKEAWLYLRGWALDSGHVFALPLYVTALTGFRGWRGYAALGLLVFAGTWLLSSPTWSPDWIWPIATEAPWWFTGPIFGALAVAWSAAALVVARRSGRAPVWLVAPAAVAWGVALAAITHDVASAFVTWVEWLEVDETVLRSSKGVTEVGRVFAVVATAVVAGLVGIGRTGWQPRLLAWAMALVTLFFAIYAGYDWMDGYRWVSFAILFLVVLLSDGIVSFATWLSTRFAVPRRASVAWRTAWALPVAAIAIAGTIHTADLIGYSETSPYDVRRRALYMMGVQERLHLDRVSLLEVDMGAHMWWSGFDVVDMAGLVDVPIAQHTPHESKDPFMREYLFQERTPEFGHVHKNWASRTKIPTHDEWDGYVLIPAYPTSQRSQHGGNHVRKSIFVQDAYTGPTGRDVGFASGVRLTGWEVPAAHIAPGHELYVEVGWAKRIYTMDVRPVIFLSGAGRVVSWEVPPGYDWLAASDWRASVVMGRHSLPIPDDLPPGTYDLGFAMLGGPDGVLWPKQLPEGATVDDPVLAHGEVRWPAAITITTVEDATQHAKGTLHRAIERAEQDACQVAETEFASARRFLRRDDPFQRVARRTFSRAIARCLARAAARDGDVESIARARWWNHRTAEVISIGRELATEWQQAGEVALANEQWDEAYAHWRNALVADPTRSWLRRRAEELRDRRLYPVVPQTSGTQPPRRGLTQVAEPR